MDALLIDTHAAIWHVQDSPRLSQTARKEIDGVIAAGDRGIVSAVTFAELIYLIEKGRIAQVAWDDLEAFIRDPNSGFEATPFDLDIADVMRQVPSKAVPDLPDRMITATALALSVPLITRDKQITQSGIVPTIW